VPPETIVEAEEIRAMLEPLSLNSDDALVARLVEIAARHLRPAQQAYLQTSLRDFREQLESSLPLRGS
jgi:hypothetical protein